VFLSTGDLAEVDLASFAVKKIYLDSFLISPGIIVDVYSNIIHNVLSKIHVVEGTDHSF